MTATAKCGPERCGLDGWDGGCAVRLGRLDGGCVARKGSGVEDRSCRVAKAYGVEALPWCCENALESPSGRGSYRYGGRNLFPRASQSTDMSSRRLGFSLRGSGIASFDGADTTCFFPSCIESVVSVCPRAGVCSPRRLHWLLCTSGSRAVCIGCSARRVLATFALAALHTQYFGFSHRSAYRTYRLLRTPRLLAPLGSSHLSACRTSRR